jgi:hypothetical protein
VELHCPFAMSGIKVAAFLGVIPRPNCREIQESVVFGTLRVTGVEAVYYSVSASLIPGLNRIKQSGRGFSGMLRPTTDAMFRWSLWRFSASFWTYFPGQVGQVGWRLEAVASTHGSHGKSNN